MPGKIKTFLVPIVWTLTLLVVTVNVIAPFEARHLFYFAAALAAIFWLSDRKKPEKEEWVLLALIVAYALYRFGHTLIDAGTLAPASDSQQVSVSIAQRFLMGGILVAYLSIYRRNYPVCWIYGAFTLALMLICLYAGYSEYILEETRQQREQRATIFAYQVIAIYFVFFGMVAERSESNRKLLFLSGFLFLLTLWVTLWTQTRSAMICLVLGSVFLLLLSPGSIRKRLLISGMLFCMVVVAVAFSDRMHSRVDGVRSDIVQYLSGENKATSLGIRFELWQAAWISFKAAPVFGPGYQQRSMIVDAEISRGNLDPILTHYKKVNVHNEFLEELSLRGLVGAFLLLAFYGYLLWLALYRRKSLSLFGLVFSYLFFGLTDVLFFSREATVLFFALLALTLSRNTPVDMPAHTSGIREGEAQS